MSEPLLASRLQPAPKRLAAATRKPARRETAAVLPQRRRGQNTRMAILEQALTDASRMSLAALSIGSLAQAMGMSKSGVFAHFGSKEELQLAVLAAYHQRFEAEVFRPALQVSSGLPRLRAIVDNWMHRVSAEAASGCLYISGAAELDDQPGPVQEALLTMAQLWRQALRRAIGMAIAQGHLQAQTDVEQWLFELQGLIFALHYDARFLRSADAIERAKRGFERLLHADAARPPSPDC